MKYDLIIPCHPKDYIKLEFCLISCIEHLEPAPVNIYIVAPNEIEFSNEKIKSVQDKDAVDIHIQDIQYRPNWIYQQFIKLCQNFTENDLYLCVDSDLIFNRTIYLFDDRGNPKFFTSSNDQEHKPYFNFMKGVYDLDKQVDHTFINDFMMFDKKVCREIVPDIHDFLSLCNEKLNDDFLLSEFELYGNYVTKNYPSKYQKVNTKNQLNGRYMHQRWSQDEIRSLVENNKNEDIDLFTVHTWT
tara:strand:- start:344 stop:1072 length:729 start_codon:yes stop_codon:yes gene_type:complete